MGTKTTGDRVAEAFGIVTAWAAVAALVATLFQVAWNHTRPSDAPEVGWLPIWCGVFGLMLLARTLARLIRT